MSIDAAQRNEPPAGSGLPSSGTSTKTGLPRERRGRVFLAGVAMTVAMLLAAIVADRFEHNPLRLLGFDFMHWSEPRELEEISALIVDIDEASLAEHGQWPWPRDVVAQLLENIGRQKPHAIGVDIVFAEPDAHSPKRMAERLQHAQQGIAQALETLGDTDAALGDVVFSHPITLGVFGHDDPGAIGDAGPPWFAEARLPDGETPARLNSYAGADHSIDEISGAALGQGFVNFPQFHDGTIRKASMIARVGGTIAPSLTLDMLRLAHGEQKLEVIVENGVVRGVGVPGYHVPTQSDGTIWLHLGRSRPERYVNASQVLRGAIPDGLFTDTFVIVGVSALGLVDQWPVALGGTMFGPEVHAQILEQIATGHFVIRRDWALPFELFLIAGLGLALAAMATWVPAGLAFTGHGAAMLATPPIALAVFSSTHLLIDWATPFVGFTLVFFTTIAVATIEGQRHRKLLDAALMREQVSAARIAGELSAARSIQLGLLPAGEARDDAERWELAAHLEPAREVGGDFYDHGQLADGRLYFAVADVSGKGVGASLFMALSKALTNSAAMRNPTSLEDLASGANEEITRVNAETMFVTACIGLLDVETGALSLCDAGHEKPAILTPGAPPVVPKLPILPPFGLMEGLPYMSETIELSPGTTIVLISDGVTEAQNADGELWGRERLDARLVDLSAAGASPHEIVAAVRADVDAHQAGNDPADDVTILAMRWNGPTGQTT